ncbi:MAG: DUF459 domain-containing protein [Microthrixaceae bacterium]|nr:DUF459 domain-containing protein [Microthrixaceae bacterium]
MPDEMTSTQRRVRNGMLPMTAWKGALVAIGVFSLLASGSFVKAARGQRDSWHRTLAVRAAESIDRVSNLLSLNRPLDWMNGELGRQDQEPEIIFPPTTVLLVAPTSTTTIPPRVPTVADPLRIRVFGDSQGYNIGYVMKSETAEDPLLRTEFEAKVSTGLARPDFYNWPARLQESLVRQDADVVVIMVGANDDQTLRSVSGEPLAEEGTPEWEVEYRRRVAGIMDLLNNGRRSIVWIGEPRVRRAKLDGALSLMNRIVVEEVARRPWVDFVETWRQLAGPNGEYVDYYTPPGKPAIRCRLSDGVHLTFGCVEIVVDKVLDVIRARYPALSPTTTTVPAVPSTATTTPTATTTTTATGPGG